MYIYSFLTCKVPVSHLPLKQFLIVHLLWWRKVKLGQTKRLADSIADVWVKEQGHATDAKVTVSVANAVSCMNLRVGPQVTNTLDVNND